MNGLLDNADLTIIAGHLLCSNLISVTIPPYAHMLTDILHLEYQYTQIQVCKWAISQLQYKFSNQLYLPINSLK